MHPFVQKMIVAFATIGLLSLSPAMAGTTPASDSAKVFFANLKDSDTVKSPFTVQFAAKHIAIDPAGEVKPNSGHYHLLIDTTLTPEQMKFAIPKDDQHLHFGKAQTETTVTLPPGKHTLQIVMGDGAHELHVPPVMSKIITVNVK